jgi:branched-chain amino acid transport system substrate-binding protein
MKVFASSKLLNEQNLCLFECIRDKKWDFLIVYIAPKTKENSDPNKQKKIDEYVERQDFQKCSIDDGEVQSAISEATSSNEGKEIVEMCYLAVKEVKDSSDSEPEFDVLVLDSQSKKDCQIELINFLQYISQQTSLKSKLKLEDYQIKKIRSIRILTFEDLQRLAKFHHIAACFGNWFNTLLLWTTNLFGTIRDSWLHYQRVLRWLPFALLFLGVTLTFLFLSWIQKYEQAATNARIQAEYANYFSRGEQSLLGSTTQSINPDCKLAFEEKAEGVLEFSKGIRTNPADHDNVKKSLEQAARYFEAANQHFEKARGSDCIGGDAETLIYLNNARALLQNRQHYTIAGALPIGGGSEGDSVSQEFVRGFATELDRINRQDGINGKLLQVLLVKEVKDDINDVTTIQKVAQYLVDNNIPGDDFFKEQENILAVIGHYTSDATRAGGVIYGNAEKSLVVLSPTSSADADRSPDPNSSNKDKLHFNDHVFRLSPRDSQAAERLSKEIQNRFKEKKAVFIAYESTSDYSSSFKNAIDNNLQSWGFPKARVCDLSAVKAEDCISLAKDAKDDTSPVLILAGTESLISVVEENYKQDKQLSIMAGDALYNSNLLMMGQAASEAILEVPWHIDLASPEFLNDSKRLWGTQDTNWRTAMAADALKTIFAAIKNQNEPSRQALYEALKSSKLDGVTGRIQFNKGDRDLEVNKNLVVLVEVQADGSKYKFKLLPQKP